YTLVTIVGGIGNAINSPFRVIGTFNRHLLDPSMTFGVTSSRYNARNDYRTEYTPGQRTAAGLGAAYGAALPAAGLVLWLKNGARVPGLGANVVTSAAGNVGGAAANAAAHVGLGARGTKAAAVAVGVTALGLATAVGTTKVVQMVRDDGNLRSVGAATGVVAGAIGGGMLGKAVAGKWAPVFALGGTVMGGALGFVGGGAIKVGPGHIGEAITSKVRVDHNPIEGAKSFATGAFTHFTEVGPASSGVSLGYAWHMRDVDQKTATTPERGGHMFGDLAAVGIMGAGAVATVGTLAKVSNAVKTGQLKGGAVDAIAVAGEALNRGRVTGVIGNLGGKALKASLIGGKSGAALAIGGITAAAGLTTLVASKQYAAQMQAMNGNKAWSTFWAGATVAATAGAAAALHLTAFKRLQSVGTMQRTAASAIGAALLIGVVSSARLPIQQFMHDAKDAHAKRTASTAVTGLAMGATGAGVGAAAFQIANKLIPTSGALGKWHVPLAIASGAVGAFAGGYAGWGVSANLPSLGVVAASGAAGAAAGAGLGAWAKGIGMPVGIIGGAAVGVLASSIAARD
ncbi:MAG: hypothetical protein JWN41_498, partial [Thermoleophilia bacterium]|nr:hypothetical protein [Thermoleophilia bacterium]